MTSYIRLRILKMIFLNNFSLKSKTNVLIKISIAVNLVYNNIIILFNQLIIDRKVKTTH